MAIKQVSVQEVKDALDRKEQFRLLDVREDFEVQIASIPGSEQLTQELGEELLARGDKSARYIFMCHHGVRSLSAAAYFAQQGFADVASMSGGIHAWAHEIDPKTPTY